MNDDEDFTINSLVRTALPGNRIYETKRSVPQCHTCQSPYRDQIEEGLASGLSAPTILGHLRPFTTIAGEDPIDFPSAESIASHRKNKHLSLTDELRQAMLDQHREAIGQNLSEDEDVVVDKTLVARMIVQRGYEMLRDGTAEPSVTEVIAAARLLQQLDKDMDENVDVQVWRDVLMVHMDVAMHYIPIDMLSEYGREIEQHPIMLALREKLKQDAITQAQKIVAIEPIQDAEIIES